MKGKASNIFVYVLLGLLILGLAGFGVTSFSGNLSAIGRVGKTDITVQDYVNALNTELRAASEQTGRPFSLAEARAIGLDRQVLASVVTQTAIAEEARRIGLSVGDERVAASIRGNAAFQGLAGNFDRDAYEFTLRQSGLTPEGFEEQIRVDSARNLLRAGAVAGVQAPATYADTVFSFIGARRSFTVVTLDESYLADPNFEPTEAELAAFHEENPSFFTEPETRQVTYAWLSPEMMEAQITIPEDELRADYEARIDEYVRPERRILYRLVIADETEAAEAAEALSSGALRFDELAEQRGVTLADIELGEVSRDDLDPEIAEAVFALEDTGVVGPLPTTFGSAFFNVAGLLNAQEIPFEDVRDDLFAEAASDRAIRAIRAELEPIDDLLAGGATLEELAVETAMELGQIGVQQGSDEGIAAYETFRNAALSVRDSDFPEIVELEDGGLFALRLDEIIPPRVLPLDEVRDQATELWRTEQVLIALRAQAETTRNVVEGGRSMAALGLAPRSEVGLTRDAFLEGFPPILMTTVFEMAQTGDFEIVEGAREIHLVRLDEILPPDDTDPDSDFLRSVLSNQANQSIALDIYDAFARELQATAGLELDQAAINAVNSSLQARAGQSGL
ncbi:MAG: SurA N-terminal domain-containing protein [Dinoroseobacter sp.]|nr:SurA N-terminal domain-containing protein [Dinoroseobacter sp.]